MLQVGNFLARSLGLQSSGKCILENRCKRHVRYEAEMMSCLHQSQACAF